LKELEKGTDGCDSYPAWEEESGVCEAADEGEDVGSYEGIDSGYREETDNCGLRRVV
jgi:hypothetical protein